MLVCLSKLSNFILCVSDTQTQPQRFLLITSFNRTKLMTTTEKSGFKEIRFLIIFSSMHAGIGMTSITVNEIED